MLMQSSSYLSKWKQEQTYLCVSMWIVTECVSVTNTKRPHTQFDSDRQTDGQTGVCVCECVWQYLCGSGRLPHYQLENISFLESLSQHCVCACVNVCVCVCNWLFAYLNTMRDLTENGRVREVDRDRVMQQIVLFLQAFCVNCYVWF